MGYMTVFRSTGCSSTMECSKSRVKSVRSWWTRDLCDRSRGSIRKSSLSIRRQELRSQMRRRKEKVASRGREIADMGGRSYGRLPSCIALFATAAGAREDYDDERYRIAAAATQPECNRIWRALSREPFFGICIYCL